MSVVLVLGGSGAVGGFLLARLHAAGHDILALSRHARVDNAAVRWLRGGLDAKLAAPDCASIVSAGPLDQFADWLVQVQPQGLRRVVALSSMSAQSKAGSSDPAERDLAARLERAERRLGQRCEQLGVVWTVLRPTLIYGAGLDRSLTPLARQAQRWRLFPLLPAARGLRQPVHADDVAAACVAALGGRAEGQVLAVGGGERLSYALMLARVREGLGRRTLPVPLTINLLRAVTRFTGRGGAMVQRLNEDLVADNAPLQTLLGLHPRAFRPGPECWIAAPRTSGDTAVAKLP
jgi:nucleoside-diphosphate-sugar epimerase